MVAGEISEAFAESQAEARRSEVYAVVAHDRHEQHGECDLLVDAELPLEKSSALGQGGSRHSDAKHL